MSKKNNSRDWSQFRTNILKYIGPSVIISIGVSLLFKSFIITGCVLIGLAGILALVLAFPSKRLNPSKFIGNSIDIDQVDNFFPELIKIAVTGVSGVGKSTFVNNFRLGNTENSITSKIEVFVSSITNNPNKYFGILDGPGHSFADQFKIINKAEILIVFLDHNLVNDDFNIDENRLRQSESFQGQLRNSLGQNNKRFKKIIVVLNKIDIWGRETDSELQKENIRSLEDWFRNQVSMWKPNYANEVIELKYSNLHTNDFISLTKYIIS